MNETEPFDLNEIINGKANPIMGFYLSVLYSFIFSEKKEQYGKFINHVNYSDWNNLLNNIIVSWKIY